MAIPSHPTPDRPGSGHPPPVPRPRRFLACLLLPLVWACGNGEPSEPRAPEGDTAESTELDEGGQTRIFDRELVFVSDAGDPVILAPWLFRVRAGQHVAEHEQRVWLAGPDGWQELASESAQHPASRAPWRILPGPRVRLVVGEGERFEALVVRDPAREMETRPREFVTEWSASRDEVVRLFRGETILDSGAVNGFVLDVSRAWESPSDFPGDWIFLHAGDDLQFFIEEIGPIDSSRTSGEYRGWSRVGFRDAQWPGVQVRWDDLRSFERARRDIPGAWSFASPGEEVVGELRSVSAQLTAEEGDGPVLPVTGLFEVEGTLRIEGREFDVIGLVRHLQY